MNMHSLIEALNPWRKIHKLREELARVEQELDYLHGEHFQLAERCLQLANHIEAIEERAKKKKLKSKTKSSTSLIKSRNK